MLSNTDGDRNQQPRRPRDRIRIDKTHHPTYIALTKPRENENHQELSPFESMKNIFMLFEGIMFTSPCLQTCTCTYMDMFLSLNKIPFLLQFILSKQCFEMENAKFS